MSYSLSVVFIEELGSSGSPPSIALSRPESRCSSVELTLLSSTAQCTKLITTI